MDLVEVVEGVATALDSEDYVATTDPARAANNRPCFLVVPPVLDYAGGTMTTPETEVRVMVLSGQGRWGVDVLAELGPLVTLAGERLQLLQRAEPGTYRLSESQTVPCYVLTTST